MTIDMLYLCHGRLEFTKASLPILLAHTDWNLVSEFVVYNDAAPDHPLTYEWLRSLDDERITLRDTNIHSPVGVMNHFLARSKAKMFAKIDNDIIVPPGWLDIMLEVMERHPLLELLGMEPGMSDQPPSEEEGWTDYSYTPSSHIGGVGLMRRSVFDRFPAPVADGRFGFTEWQHEHEPNRGWVCPDIRMFALDLLPIEPWYSITSRYRETPGLQRGWPTYNLGMSYYWDWFA